MHVSGFTSLKDSGKRQSCSGRISRLALAMHVGHCCKRLMLTICSPRHRPQPPAHSGDLIIAFTMRLWQLLRHMLGTLGHLLSCIDHVANAACSLAQLKATLKCCCLSHTAQLCRGTTLCRWDERSVPSLQELVMGHIRLKVNVAFESLCLISGRS